MKQYQTLGDLLKILQMLTPLELAESWDHVGLQHGQPAWRVKKALLCIDLTMQVLREAVQQRADLIVAYHPPIFDPLPSLLSSDAKQRIILGAIEKKIALYSPHTALDSAAGGVNDWLADALLPGIWKAVLPDAPQGSLARGGSIRPIRPSKPKKDSRPYKLVTFVPPKHLEKLRAALCDAGAGQIGDYSQCSFSHDGEGTFQGSSTTHPVLGKAGRFERVIEKRLEIIVPADRMTEVVAALHQSHPYEEPAFDLTRLDLPPSSGGEAVGQGRVVKLDEALSLSHILAVLKKHLGVKQLEVAIPPGNSSSVSLTKKSIRKIGLCAGAGGSLLNEAGKIDLFITGEMRHHDVLTARAKGIAVILAGHTQTERPYLPVYRKLLAAAAKEITWTVSKADEPPTKLV